MSDIAISAENLSKRYLIGHRTAERERYVALRDVIGREARSFIRKAGDLLRGRQIVEGDRLEEFWALKGVDFEVRQGEAVGIIGRNGAGKSTLLKILSRITPPTGGRARLRGRAASLLEIGTGFHPELSGRENIYLNGAILGMSRGEVRAKFDEIATFAEIGAFLDTPVKRYSSGMYVRLAFAVAAHLEPDILIIDEVLSVGDAEFQRKCMGKMQEAAQHGRTVLFVSHNLPAIRALTGAAMVLERGRIAYQGSAAAAVDYYAASLAVPAGMANTPATRGQHASIRAADLLDAQGRPTASYMAGEPLRLRVTIETDGTPGLSFDAYLLDRTGTRIAFYAEQHFYGRSLPREAGTYELSVSLNPLWLAAGAYYFDLVVSVTNVTWDHYAHRALAFEVPYCNPGNGSWDFTQASGYGVFALTEMSERRCRALPAPMRERD